MTKQALDTDLVDVELSEEILSSIARAEGRGVAAPTIIGTLFGCGVGVGKETDANLSDLQEVVAVCWTNDGE